MALASVLAWAAVGPVVTNQPCLVFPNPMYCKNATRADGSSAKAYFSVDWCVSYGENCGQGAADSFCRSQDFNHSIAYVEAVCRYSLTASGDECDMAKSSGNTCGCFDFIECC